MPRGHSKVSTELETATVTKLLRVSFTSGSASEERATCTEGHEELYLPGAMCARKSLSEIPRIHKDAFWCIHRK